MWGIGPAALMGLGFCCALGFLGSGAASLAAESATPGPGLAQEQVLVQVQSAPTTTIQTPFYACFDPALALRIGAEAEGRTVRFWVRERFESGSCLALAEGTAITYLTSVRIEGRYAQKFRLKGASGWLYRPDWAMEINPQGGPTPTQEKFSSFIPATTELLFFAAKHMACLKEVTELNARVEEHNREFLEQEEKLGNDEAVTKTVIIFNPSGLQQRGARLNREIEAFRARCNTYQTLEASSSFVDMAREIAGLSPRPPPSAA